MAILAFDILLALALIWSAVRSLTVRDLFRAVILFIVFGLLMALAWARLDAPDIALAEAAIGAGLAGAMLLDTVGHLRACSSKEHRS
jgi:energy-converting hydrogenase B subunit D